VDGVISEMKFMKIWSSQWPYLRLGLTTTMVSFMLITIMGYRFSRQTFFSSFSPYFLLFDFELELPTSI
jgi:hypothetical protein